MDSAAGRHLPPQRGDLGQHRQQHPAQHIAGDGLAHTYGNGVVGEGTGKGTGEAGLLEADDIYVSLLRHGRKKAIATWKSRFRKAGEPALPIPFPETIICSAAKYSR